MADGLMERFLNSSHFSGGNAAYIEELTKPICTSLIMCQRSGVAFLTLYLALTVR